MSVGVVRGILGGIGRGRMQRRESDRRDADVGVRQGDATIRREAADRATYWDQWNQKFRGNMSNRPEMGSQQTDPSKGPVTSKPSIFNTAEQNAAIGGEVPVQEVATPQNVTPAEAPMPMAGEALPAGAQQAGSAMNLTGAGEMQGPIELAEVAQPMNVTTGILPGYADGGAINVPTQQYGPQAPPVQQIVPAPTPQQAAPQQAPQEDTRTYRERLAEWNRKAEADAMMAGGLEGLEKFREMENATSRRMVLGYGLQAIRALDENNVGEAMKAGNTALEATPFDHGLKFIAHNGELRMVGQDGKPGEPLKADHLRAFVEDNMKTPESYLDWKKQYETERSNTARESIASRGTAVQEGYLGIAQEKAPADLSKIGAEIYSLIMGADARMLAASKADSTPGLTPTLVRNINNDIPTLIQNAKLDPGTEWWGQMTQNPGLAGVLQSSAIDMAKMNLLEQGNYADAIGLSAYAFAPAAGIQLPKGAKLGGIGIKGEGDDARAYALWNGKELWIPPAVYSALLLQHQDITAKSEKEAPAEEAVPTKEPSVYSTMGQRGG